MRIRGFFSRMDIEKQNEWRKSWNTSDKAWSQARKKEWGRINEKLKSRPFSFVRIHDNIKRLKSYFLTGYPPGSIPDNELDQINYYIRPLAGIPGEILFECMLSPDHSDEFTREVISRYPEYLQSNRYRFREMMRDFFPEKEGTLFDGLEPRFYILLGGNRCRHDVDYGDLDENEYLKRCHAHFQDCTPNIDRVLFAEPEDVNPDDIAHLMLPEFLDSYAGAFEYGVNFEYEDGYTFKDYGLDEIRRAQIERCREIVDADSAFHPRQVEIAKKLLSTIRDLKLHEELDKVLAPYFNNSDQ